MKLIVHVTGEKNEKDSNVTAATAVSTATAVKPGEATRAGTSATAATEAQLDSSA